LQGLIEQRAISRADYDRAWSKEGVDRGFASTPVPFLGLSPGDRMLKVDVQTLGGVAIFRCQGRIVADDESTILRNAVRSEANYSALILDLAVVAGIDAGGLGALLGLHAWARSNRIQLKLMNVPNTVRQVLEVTNLDRVFEICTEKELVNLLHRAAGMAPSSRQYPDQPKTADRDVTAAVLGGR
jgi:anti-anti-sigma factor